MYTTLLKTVFCFSFVIFRLKLWIKNSGNLLLLAVESTQLHSKYFLCAEHFDANQFYNIDCKTLLPTATPTIFSCNPLSDLQMTKYPILGLEYAMFGRYRFYAIYTMTSRCNY